MSTITNARSFLRALALLAKQNISFVYLEYITKLLTYMNKNERKWGSFPQRCALSKTDLFSSRKRYFYEKSSIIIWRGRAFPINFIDQNNEESAFPFKLIKTFYAPFLVL